MHETKTLAKSNRDGGERPALENESKSNLPLETAPPCVLCGQAMLRVPFYYVCLRCGTVNLTRLGVWFYTPSEYEVRNEREKRTVRCLSAQIG